MLTRLYRCRYKQRDGRERWQTLRAVGSVAPVTRTTVYGLLPDTSYQFMVLARNRLGDGQFSNVVDAATSGSTRPPPWRGCLTAFDVSIQQVRSGYVSSKVSK